MNQQLNITTSYLFEMPAPPVTVSSASDGRGYDGSFEESIFVTHARRQDYTVFLPFGHSQKADVVIWKPPFRPITIQVKRGFINSGSGGYCCCVSSKRSTKDHRSALANGRSIDRLKRYRAGDFDILAMFHPPTEGFYFWKLVDVFHRKTVSMPLAAQLNNWHVIEQALAS